MTFHYKDAVKYFSFSSFGEDVRHGIFTRLGGISPSPWDSLNMGGTVGDEANRVSHNRQLAFNALDLDPKTIFDVWQEHGTTVALADKPRLPDAPHQKADIILTDRSDVTLVMRLADCTPIFLHDPVKKVIGLVHTGWLGTVHSAVKVAVEAMVKNYTCTPGDIQAGIGPSIGPDHYEVGEDVAEEVIKTFGINNSILHSKGNGKYLFDLWEANRLLLETCGVKKIEISGLCTVCNLGDWFSHRAERGMTGRFGALFTLLEADGR
jgi:YfiH family protein